MSKSRPQGSVGHEKVPTCGVCENVGKSKTKSSALENHPHPFPAPQPLRLPLEAPKSSALVCNQNRGLGQQGRRPGTYQNRSTDASRAEPTAPPGCGVPGPAYDPRTPTPTPAEPAAQPPLLGGPPAPRNFRANTPRGTIASLVGVRVPFQKKVTRRGVLCFRDITHTAAGVAGHTGVMPESHRCDAQNHTGVMPTITPV